MLLSRDTEDESNELSGGVERCRVCGGPLLEKREKWRTPSYSGQCCKDKPALHFPVEVAHPPANPRSPPCLLNGITTPKLIL